MGFWSSKRVLVTGGAGFIGSHVVDRLIQLGATVSIADNLSKGSLQNLREVWSEHGLDVTEKNEMAIRAGDHTFMKCDLEDPAQVREAMKGCDVVIHLAAAIGGRGYIETHPADCCSNLALNYNVFSEAVRAGVERVHYASSACVYPVALQDRYDSDYILKEDDAFRNGYANCDREYGWAKFMGEVDLWAHHKQYGLKGSICRYVTAYGPRENDTHAIVALIRKAVERQDPYVIWGTGEQDRDFTYVSDIVEGTLLATEKITDAIPINLGTSKRYKIKEVAEAVLKIAGHQPNLVFFDTSKPEGVKTRALDITRAKQLLGWEPKVNLRDGLLVTYQWYLKTRPSKVEVLE